MIGLLERVAGTIERHGMLAPGQRVGAAVSGGPDSVCLLHVLLDLASRWDLRVSVLHVNHRLRGEESAADAEFVRDLAGRRGLPFHLREADVANCPGNLEQAARTVRLAFFHQMIASGTVDRVALGHTRSDQAETVLFRFLRGAGTAGLAGIRPMTSEGLVRPLLEVDRSQVEDYLREKGLSWREDSSNAGMRFARNRIRHSLLPQLTREWNPGIRELLANTADWALWEEAYWDAEIARLAAAHFMVQNGAVIVRVDTLASLPLAVARRLVRHAILGARGNLRRIDFGHIGTVLELAVRKEGHGRVALPDLEVTRSFDWLRFATHPVGVGTVDVGNYRFPTAVPGTLRVPGTATVISLELIEKRETLARPDYVYNDEVGCLDWGSLSGSLEWRNWQPGDRYQPAGSVREEKIKALFQHARIPLWERRHWPILVDGASIVWARRFGPAAGLVASGATGTILRVRETQEPVGEFGIGSSGSASNEVRAGTEVL